MFTSENGDRPLRLGDPGTPVLHELAKRLIHTTGVSTGNRYVPAGYTYLGQFIDHDITFDPTSKLASPAPPTTLRNFRTPRFDLDSLYGSGPLDQPFLYDWDEESVGGVKRLRGVKMLVGSNTDEAGVTVADLPRNEQHRALVGDPRNDENIIVTQLQLLFIHFHNRVVDRVIARDDTLRRDTAFAAARELVLWHYQWIVVHDFLPKIVGKKMADSVLPPAGRGKRPTVDLHFFDSKAKPFMPVEFSGAAYRFGHSMVRDNYVLNDHTKAVSVFGPGPGRNPETLIGRRPLPPELEIDWTRFFAMSPTLPNRSMRIDPFLSPTLRHVPPSGRPLAELNLRRGVTLMLPSGQAVAERLGVPALSDEQLLAPVPGFAEDLRPALFEATPLWYYVLCEAGSAAGLNGLRLGRVGGRIVAEVLAGLLAADKGSYFNAEGPWAPVLPQQGDDFTMADLVRYALGETPL
jgi:hypothetical protein